ncbi:MAG: glucose-1-phosphate adenylyltransferase subunit GlgD, partial [Firmicutes bacterium]|nr:glucose-1-phosphate adenylyltransferase subunit GlgD [Bacillota bacterium]
IISRSVKVEEGATVRNSIILTDTTIGKGIVLNNVVVDKYAHLIHAQEITGEPDVPLYIKQGDVI